MVIMIFYWPRDFNHGLHGPHGWVMRLEGTAVEYIEGSLLGLRRCSFGLKRLLRRLWLLVMTRRGDFWAFGGGVFEPMFSGEGA